MSNDRTVGDELFATVREYADLGDHRAGTHVDELTVDWVSEKLRDLGASVRRDRYSFVRYDASWEVRVDGSLVPSIPLFYEGTGNVKSDSPVTATLRVVAGAVLPELSAFTAEALGRGAEVAVVATEVGNGLLCAANRDPIEGSGLPVVCVAGTLAEQLTAARVEVELAARLVSAESYNVIAELGDAPANQRVLLTTPLSGWFRCAGERGTGVAVCLAVAKALSEQGVGVTVLGTNGHELNGLGVHHHLAHRSVEEKAIFHFGASVGSGDSDGVNPPSERTALLRPSAWAGDGRRQELAEALAPLGVAIRLPSDDEARSPDGWVGESAVWAPLGKPLVSIAGGFPLHHAPEDLPEVATTPELLDGSYRAALAAARVLASV